jgi:hypothetical protein
MRSLFVLLTILPLLCAPDARCAAPNPYPNELSEFKFYASYLAPLRPYVSDRISVAHILGSDQGRQLKDWRIGPLFIGTGNTVNGHPWAQDISGRLASVDMTPKHRVSMLHVKFPTTFTHSTGSVSEINVVCDVYEDSFGLKYWIYAEDMATHRKGDLMRIEYGPSKRVEREVVGPS